MVIRDEPDTQTDTGLHIANPEEKNTGIILMVGPGTDRDPMLLKKGQHVLWNKNTRIEEIPGKDTKYLLMYASDIIGIIK